MALPESRLIQQLAGGRSAKGAQRFDQLDPGPEFFDCRRETLIQLLRIILTTQYSCQKRDSRPLKTYENEYSIHVLAPGKSETQRTNSLRYQRLGSPIIDKRLIKSGGLRIVDHPYLT